MNLLGAVVIAFSMYSRIPMPRIEWTKERMRYMLCFFPLVGAAIGAGMLLWMRFGRMLAGDGNFFRAVLVMIPVFVTGGIHLDGLLDTADALSSYKPIEEKLEILKDSHAGAFAIIFGASYFLLMFGLYSEVTAEQMRLLAVGFVLSRALSGLSVVLFKKAKNSGLAASFSDMAQQKCVGAVMIFVILLCGAALLALDPVLGGAVLLAAAAVFGYYRWMSYRKFGGITGDLAGFFLQVCELMMALFVVIAARLTGIGG